MQKCDASLLLKDCDVQPQYVYESTIYPQNLLNTLNEQRKFGLLCDITVIVEGVQLLAHKAVLAACSSYFNGIIMNPANVSHNIVLELSSITKVGMENLLEFAYTSKLTVSKDNIDHVLCAARELEVKNLEYSCLNLLKQKLFQDSTGSNSVSTCFDSDKVCRNSTISRRLVQSNMESSSNAYEKCSTRTHASSTSFESDSSQDQQLMARNNCPLMSQLSLNPKPQAPIQCVPNSSTDKVQPISEHCGQSAINALKNLCSLEKADRQASIGKILPQVKINKSAGSVPDVKMLNVCSSENDPAVSCSIVQPVSANPFSDASNKSKCLFSQSVNSDTDEALSTDDDIERNYKCLLSLADNMCKSRKHPDIELPLSVAEITRLPRSELQELLNKHPNLSVQQISALHEIRRRGKNRIAAQRCRKRKMDCIRGLQSELEILHREHNDLMNERRSVCKNAGKLCELFQKRYAEVFSGISTPCEKTLKEDGGAESIGTENAVVTMAKYFQNESHQVKEMVDRLQKFPCNDLPPLTLACPMMNQEIVVVCDEEERCYKPCSPSMCSTASFSSDITEGLSTECSGSQDAASSLFLVQRHALCKGDNPITCPSSSKSDHAIPVSDVSIEAEHNHDFTNSSANIS